MKMLMLAAAALIAAPVAAAPAKKPVKPRPAAARVVKPAVETPAPDTPEVQALRRAFHYAFPVYEMMRTRAGVVTRAQAAGASGVNMIFARKRLADATTRDVTTPNNDTLYATAWLDLANGPVTLTVPDLAGRYNSAALMNLFTDNVAILDSRTGGGGTYTIAGPGFAGKAPEGTTLVKLDTNDAWLLVRVYVNGAADLDAAGAAIDRYTLSGGGAAVPMVAVPTATPDAPTLLAVVNEALGRSGIAPRHADLGIRPGVSDAWAELPPETRKLWTDTLPALRRELKGGFAQVGTVVDGWSYPGPGIGNFSDDDAGRAAVALGGLAALPRQEAVYLSASADKDGAPLTGAKAYTVKIPPRPPVGAFWSLTLYKVEPDGRLFFIDNPLSRFSIGSGSRSIHYERDGSLDIFVQQTRPSGERVVNWLPAPPGPFRLVWRAYLPKAELLDGSFRLPPVVATEVVP
ncbi:DUF1254 domain-containing protein [Glacieibacterium frigidum]|nr:DUF1254 domain-containing protein [Glacieibacterium frigidum]